MINNNHNTQKTQRIAQRICVVGTCPAKIARIVVVLLKQRGQFTQCTLHFRSGCRGNAVLFFEEIQSLGEIRILLNMKSDQ